VRLWWQPLDVPVEEPAPTLIVRPGGSLVDPIWAATEAARCRELEKSLAAQRASKAEDAEADIAAAQVSGAEREAAHRRELPEHLRNQFG
jgi:hypothetical protein